MKKIILTAVIMSVAALTAGAQAQDRLFGGIDAGYTVQRTRLHQDSKKEYTLTGNEAYAGAHVGYMFARKWGVFLELGEISHFFVGRRVRVPHAFCRIEHDFLSTGHRGNGW